MESEGAHLVEEDRIPALKLMVWSVLLLGAVIGCILGVRQVFFVSSRYFAEQRAMDRTGGEIATQRAALRSQLESYERMDTAEDRYRLPIDRAMQLLVEQPDLVRGDEGASSAPAPTDAPGAGVVTPED